MKLLQGDCLELIKDIPDKSIDMILCDLPYGTTRCRWDTIIPFDKLWKQYYRIIKDNGAIVLFGSEPFSSALRISSIKNYKYDWIWEKSKGSNFVHANFQPLKVHETISIFSLGGSTQGSKNPMIYNPQHKDGKPYDKGVGNNPIEVLDGGMTKSDSIKHINISGKRKPRSVIYNRTAESEGKLHPTQKPVALFEYLIKTYTNEGDLVLDNCMGSGTTGVACKNINRDFIGIELDEKYFDIAKERIENTTYFHGKTRCEE
ncbi:MAG: DNA-methyltransferase [Candidatus Heimdallarchaeaceae archaeon]